MRRLLTMALLTGISAFSSAQEQGIAVVVLEGRQRVDVTVAGAPFTSYLWGTSQKKPVLYPLIAPGGVEVTRGYPLAPREGERTDHPHHAGMWFSYGNVDGFDFWNNSDAIKPEDRSKMGTIHHVRVVSAKSGAREGELVTESLWTNGAGEDVLAQTTRYVFTGDAERRRIDETVTLRALRPVVFHDDKEGMLGIRVAHFLESANEKGGSFTDANGRATAVQASNVPGATGVYRTDQGKVGDAVWGTRGQWCVLTGKTPGGLTTSIAILDHPDNPNYPTYWHARGYGLFAANAFGQQIFDPKAAPLNFTLAGDAVVTFRYRVLLRNGALTDKEIGAEAVEVGGRVAGK